MPAKEVTSLLHLCLNNIATNVVRHSLSFNEVQVDKKIYYHYRSVQKFFMESLLEAIKYIYKTELQNVVSEKGSRGHLIDLTTFLFKGRVRKKASFLWPCLKFLFNEYTDVSSLRIPLLFPSTMFVPKLFFDALSLCTNLKCLRLHFCSFPENQLLQSCNWRSLVELDLLLSSSSDSDIIFALKNCPDLQILKASGRNLTDECLFCLCHEWTIVGSGNFRFCQLEGRCCSVGKKIKKLVLYGTKITARSIACALQHLPLLEEFLEGGVGFNDPDLHLVARGVSQLKRACQLLLRPFPTLKLTTMIYDKYMTESLDQMKEIFLCCPSVYRLVLSMGRVSGRSMSFMHCHKTSTLGLSNSQYRPDIRRMISMTTAISKLPYMPLKNLLVVGCVSFSIEDYEAICDNFNLPAHIQHLEQISIIDVKHRNSSFLSFLTQLLSKASNLRSLTLHGFAADVCFVSAMEENEFNSLEEVTISHADLNRISFKDLIRRRTCLKKITYLACKNTESFVEDHKDFARKNNFDVDIYAAERNISHWTIIQYNLI